MKPKDKKELLQDFVSALKKNGLIKDEEVILDELLKREALGSTGLERGIAVPHALTDKVEETLVALALVKDGIDYEAADGQPTFVIIILLGNKKNPGNQLKILAHICRMVKETDVVEKIKKSKSAMDICQIFTEEEGKIA